MEGFFLDIKQVSSYLNIKPSLIYSFVESKEIPHYRVGRLIRFKKEEVDQWIKGHKVPSQDEDVKVKGVLGSFDRSKMSIDSIVKRSIERTKETAYTPPVEKPGRIKGLKKEVNHGAI